MNKGLIIAVLLSAALPLIAEEQGVLKITESGAIQMALESNLTLSSSRLDLQDSEAQAGNNWNILLPDFSASTGVSRTDSFLNDSGASGRWSVSGSLSADLKLNAASALYGKSNNLAYDSQLLGYSSSRSQLILNVRKQYYYLLAYRENLDLQRKNLELAEKRYIQAENNFNNGFVSELTALEARNSFESLKPSLQDAETLYETQIMVLKRMIGLELSREIEIEGTLDVTYSSLDTEGLLDRYLMNRFDVQQAVKSLEIAENQENMTRAGNMSPVLSLSTGWVNSAPDVSSLDWSDTFTFSAYLTVPLNTYIPGSSESLSNRSAQRAVEKAKIGLDDVIQNAEQEVRTILMELDGARKKIEKNQVAIELAQRTFEMTEAAYLQGSKEVLDVEAAQNNLLNALQDLLLSKYNYLSGLLDLEYALNAEIEEIRKLGE